MFGMKRSKKIEKLKQVAPVLVAVTATQDMGYEFCAVVPEGVIYSEPGMLLNYSQGRWPPDEWKEEEAKELLDKFLLSSQWSVTKWSDLSDEDLDSWYEDVCG